MIKVIGIKFPYTLKIQDFIPGEHEISLRDLVLVETGQGVEIGEAVYLGKTVKVSESESLGKVIRVAKKADLEKRDELEEKAKSIYPLFLEKIKKYNLPMTPVGSSYSFDEAKAIFYFTAEGRVDFRELAKDLSRSIQKQAILRQIGPRDEAKLIGGYGRCGRQVCCASFLLGTEGVTMDVVERQFGGPRNASKISGICGRLMCCLNYEQAEKLSQRRKKDE